MAKCPYENQSGLNTGKKTFTKIWFRRILLVALIDMQLSYVLAFLGKENIAETLSVTIAAEIIGVFTAYCVKSFRETKEAEDVRLKEKLLEREEHANEMVD